MTIGSRLSIGVLLPDVLGTYGDSGNATVLAQRARWAGIPADVVAITADMAPPTTCDIYVIGGGEDVAQAFAARWLAGQRSLRTVLGGSATVLAVCAGFQIVGTDFTDPCGVRHAGLDLVDATTVPRPRRATGEVVARCVLSGVGLLSGFANHGGATHLGPETTPLAHVLSGCGNGSTDVGQTRAEGAIAPRLLATYLHGPVLARNPDVADHLLRLAVGPTFVPPSRDRVPDEEAMRRAHVGRRREHVPPAAGAGAMEPLTGPRRAPDDGVGAQLLPRIATVVLLVTAVVVLVLAVLGVRA